MMGFAGVLGRGEPRRRVGSQYPEVRIPRGDSEGQRLFMEEELLPSVVGHSETSWVIDLSEYQDGVTLAFAGTLANFREEARLRGCEVKYKGLIPGGISCAARPLRSIASLG